MKSSRVTINTAAISKRLFNSLVEEQTRRLIKYAEDELKLIGDEIKMYGGGNNMQRTYNLLDSLCWGVSYNGELKGYGFYEEQRATKLSYLHEWSGDYHEYPVGGHVLADNFIKQMGNLKRNGWSVFFAVLAPYWGYWEKGFKIYNKARTEYKTLQWNVMFQYYDKIRGDLKPSKVKYSVSVDTSKRWKPRKDTGYENPRYNKYYGKGYKNVR